MTEYFKVRASAFDLLNYVAQKYDIKNYEGFTCPYMKALAESIYFFGQLELRVGGMVISEVS